METLVIKTRNKVNAKFILELATKLGEKGQILKNNKSEDFWNDLSVNEQSEIRKGISDLDNGKRVEFSEFLRKIS